MATLGTETGARGTTYRVLFVDQSGRRQTVRLGGVSKMIAQHIRTKICGYAAQDRFKNLFSEGEFVKFQDVLDLFKTSELKCYYCKEKTMALYEYVREPKQWTLERIDNNVGHNTDNVEIACLLCNLRRRTMYHERYVFTKQMNIVKLDS